MMRVFTKRRIEKGTYLCTKMFHIELGEELSISYIDTNAPVKTRRQNLSQNYFFDCVCSRCTSELQGNKKRISYTKTKL